MCLLCGITSFQAFVHARDEAMCRSVCMKVYVCGTFCGAWLYNVQCHVRVHISELC